MIKIWCSKSFWDSCSDSMFWISPLGLLNQYVWRCLFNLKGPYLLNILFSYKFFCASLLHISTFLENVWSWLVNALCSNWKNLGSWPVTFAYRLITRNPWNSKGYCCQDYNCIGLFQQTDCWSVEIIFQFLNRLFHIILQMNIKTQCYLGLCPVTASFVPIRY